VIASAILRVFCVDGPVRGVRYLDHDTARVLFEEAGRRHVYRVSAGESAVKDFGRVPKAYFDHSEPRV
jgi:hypothetical protein